MKHVFGILAVAVTAIAGCDTLGEKKPVQQPMPAGPVMRNPTGAMPPTGMPPQNFGSSGSMGMMGPNGAIQPAGGISGQPSSTFATPANMSSSSAYNANCANGTCPNPAMAQQSSMGTQGMQMPSAR